MAYYNSDLEEEQNTDPNAPAAAAPAGESGTITGQGSAGSNTGAASAAQAPASGAPVGDSPGNFVGIQQYIDANKPQTKKLASDVSGYVNDLGNQARTKLEAGQQGFNQAVDSNTIHVNQDLLNEASNNPNAVAQDQGKLQEFKKERDATYKGPTSFDQSDFYKPASDAIQKANKASENTGTQSGQQDLLSQIQTAKKGSVRQGALAFDSALLQSDPNSKLTLEQTRKDLSDIPGKLTAAQQAAATKATQGAADTAATKAAIQGAFTGQNDKQVALENQLKAKALAAIGQSKAQSEQTLNLLKSGAEPNDAQLDTLDITRDQWNKISGDRSYLKNTYGVNPYGDLSSYGNLKNAETQINAQNIATADDYARYSALNQLMDKQNNFLSDPTQAGTADLDSLEFNYSGASGDIQNSIQMQRQQAAQRAAEEAAAAERARQSEDAKKGRQTVLGSAAGWAVGGPTGAAIGGIFCFIENTPILMSDGTFCMVQDLQIGDHVRYGGLVMGHGASLCQDVVEYKGKFTSENHAIFDGEKFVRALHIKGGVIHSLEKPIVVYPVVTERHVLISNNGVVYADMMEVNKAGISDAEKLELLNAEDNLEFAEFIEKEISWVSLSSEQTTMMH